MKYNYGKHLFIYNIICASTPITNKANDRLTTAEPNRLFLNISKLYDVVDQAIVGSYASEDPLGAQQLSQERRYP